MKTILNKALYRISVLLFCLYGYVAHADCINGVDENGDPCFDPNPPGDPVPIDENIIILVFIAVIFGIYTIYNYKLNKKRPI